MMVCTVENLVEVLDGGGVAFALSRVQLQSGGGLHAEQVTRFEIEYCTLSKNEAGTNQEHCGGGLYSDSNALAESTTNLNHCTIDENIGQVCRCHTTALYVGAALLALPGQVGGGLCFPPLKPEVGQVSTPKIVIHNTTINGNQARQVDSLDSMFICFDC